jgi:hypothetical protein
VNYASSADFQIERKQVLLDILGENNIEPPIIYSEI